MKKTSFLCLLILLLAGVKGTAQYATMGVHVSTGISSKTETLSSNVSLGGGAAFNYYFSDYFSMGAEFQYLGFAFDTGNVFVTILPLQLSMQGHIPLNDNVDVYAGTGGGPFFARYSDPSANLQTETLWGLTPRVGIRFQVAQDLYLNVNGNYFLVLTDNIPDDVSGIVSINFGIAYNVTSEL